MFKCCFVIEQITVKCTAWGKVSTTNFLSRQMERKEREIPQQLWDIESLPLEPIIKLKMVTKQNNVGIKWQIFLRQLHINIFPSKS